MKNPKASDVKKGIAALWETLQCPICLDLITTPISTKCDHQFCKFCIMKLLDGSKQSKANCPVCKSKITKRSLQESPGFQRLVTGLQDMIQAYEHDTGTNYFTGVSPQKGDSRVKHVDITENPCNISSGNTFNTNLDNMEQKERDVPLKSISSTVEAQNGFAQVMELEDSSPFMTENEGLDSGLGDAPPTSDNKMSSPPDNLEPETTNIREKPTHRSKSKKKSAKLENASLCAAPPQEETEHRLLRKSSRTKRKTDLESDRILEQKKKKSLEKVAEWLMKVPAEADLELEKPLEKADDSDSCSSTSALDVEPHNFELNPRKEDHAKALEEQVFGAVYKRKSKGFEPPTAAEVLSHKRVSKLRKKKCTTLGKEQKVIENKDDTMSDFFEEVEQMKVGHKYDMSKNVEEFNQISVNDKNEEHDVSCPVSDVIQQQLETVTKKITRKTVQQVDSDLQDQAHVNSKSSEQKKVCSNGKTTRLEKKKLNKWSKPLVLVGVQNRDTSSKARERSEEVQVQIENYPSSEDQDTPVFRRTRRSKRLQLCVEEVQESHKKATVKTCVPKKDRNVTKSSEVSKGEILNLAPNVAQTNGCVYDQDIGGIESLESVKKTFHLAQAEKEKPHETLSEVVAESCASVLPNSTSASDASVVAPTFENDKLANSPPNKVQQEPPVIEAKRAQTESEANDSELDTEQLLRSFKAAKRKSFHLGDPNLKRSRLSDKENVNGTEAEDGFEISQKQMSREILKGSKNADESTCSDLIPPSNSPIQRKTTVDKPDHTVVEASIPDSSYSGQDCAAGNCLSSGLSPNKVSKLDRESPSLSVVPQVVDSCLQFTTVEPEELNEVSMGSQVREGQLDFGKVTETDPNEHNLNTESSLTPNDLMPLALQNSYKTTSSCSAEVNTHSSIKPNSRKKRRAQKLESSSESDSSESKEELPTLTQLFGASTHPPAGVKDQGGSSPEKTCESVCDKTNGAEAQICPSTCPSPDCINSSQASVDLFGTPDECDVPENDTGVSMESSQFSSEVLVTQQKIEMQKELVRLGKLISLVSEVLQEKEGSPVREGPSETHQGCENTSPDGHKSLLHEQEPDQDSCRKGVPDVDQGPSMRPSEEKGMTEASQSRHGGITETVSSVKDTKSTYAVKTTKGCDSPSDGHEDKENNSPPTERRNVKLVLVSSGLGTAEQILVKKFAKRVGARVVSQVTPEVTHIIMRTDEQLVCERTLKYFLGIAGRKWVVSFQWISECFKQKKLLDESPFEVRGDVVNGPNHQGPSRARNTEASNLLMKGYKICFQGPFTDMSTDELEWMVGLCGAAVVKDPLLLDSKQKSHQLVIVQPRPESSSSAHSDLSRKATVVTRGWLLDTVATYTLQNFNNYT